MAKHLMRPLGRDSHPIGAEQYAPAITAAWLAAFPDSRPEERDKEDWVENACFLESFTRLGLEHEIMGSTPAVWISASADTLVSGEGEAAFFHSGIKGSDHTTGIDFSLPLQSTKALDAIGKHATSETFRKHAGRQMELVRPDGQAVSEAIRRIVPGSGEIFIKTIKKEMAQRYSIEAGKDPWEQICAQDEGIMWSTIQYEGNTTPYFSVQGVIEPTHEYRIFMVGDRPVTGAGCVEAFTPLDNWDVFDPKMEPVRNRTGVITARDVLDAYREFAEAFGKEFAAENGKALAYSLDLCLDRNTGKVVPIELNPPMNLGRYASDIDAWVLAIDELLGEIA